MDGLCFGADAATDTMLTRRLVAAAGWTSVLLLLALVARFWHPVYGLTTFIELGSHRVGRTVAAFDDVPVFAHHDSPGYDGQYYAQIAHDPLLRTQALRDSIDELPYRGRRILVPAAAWAIGAGRSDWIVAVYPFVNLIAWIALAAIVWRLFAVTTWRAWFAWAGVVFSTGAIGSVREALIDLPALALVAAAMLAASRRRPSTGAGWLAAAALARETSILALPAIWTDSWREPRALMRNLRRSLVVVTPLAIWWTYVAWHVGSSTAGDGNLGWPVVAILARWEETVRGLSQQGDHWLAWTTLAGVAGLSAQLLFVLTRWRPADAWWRLGAAFAALAICLGTPVWEGYPGAAARVLLPLTLAVNALLARTRAPVAWLVACNLTIASGLYTLRYVPDDPNELAAAHRAGASAILALESGWHGRESIGDEAWAWTDASGRLRLRTWPRTSVVNLMLTMHVQSAGAGVVSVMSNDRLVWQQAMTADQSAAIDLPLNVSDGELTVTVSTDATLPGVQGSDATAHRGVALFDPRVRVLGVRQ